MDFPLVSCHSTPIMRGGLKVQDYLDIAGIGVSELLVSITGIGASAGAAPFFFVDLVGPFLLAGFFFVALLRPAISMVIFTS